MKKIYILFLFFSTILGANAKFLQEMQTEVVDSNIIINQMYVEEKEIFDKKMTQLEKEKATQKVPYNQWKKKPPHAQIQKKGVFVED